MGRNIVVKGEIARYEQFLLLPQYFQNACLPGVSKGVIVWEWVKGSDQGQPTQHAWTDVGQYFMQIPETPFL